MKRQVAKVWDTKPGRYITGRTSAERRSLLADGWTPAGAERYARVMDFVLGRGLKKRIREAVN